MKDIPIFTAANGIASLILREIPYRKEAFVQVRGVFTQLPSLLKECASFCRMAGAERVFATGKEDFSAYPIHARLMEREIAAKNLPSVTAEALPTAEAEWLSCYRKAFRNVPAARTLDAPEHCYWILENGERIGLGQIHNGRLLSVAALKRSAGEHCVCALAAKASEPSIRLLCAAENLPAMHLYDRLGFSCGSIRECWYEITQTAL